MSNDLISRKYLLEIASREGAHDYVSAEEIAKAPTAYDVDEKVEKLKERAEGLSGDVGFVTYEGDIYKDGVVTGIQIAIEVIKGKLV